MNGRLSGIIRQRGGMPVHRIDEIMRVFQARGDEAYFGEPVSQKEHALQAAHFAEKDGADDALVVAALLHDVGHLVHGVGEDAADRGVDAHHEDAGHEWLADLYGPEVTEPIRLHVAAKRYLCAVDRGYLERLSPASLQSLELQGGPFGPAEVRDFETHPRHRDAVRLRLWDDLAKVPGMKVPGLEHYRTRLEAVALRGS